MVKAGKPLRYLVSVIAVLVVAGCSTPSQEDPKPQAAPSLPSNEIEYADCLMMASSLQTITQNIKNGEDSLVQIGFELLAEDASTYSAGYSGTVKSLLSSLSSASATHAASIANGGELNGGETFDRFREAFVALDPYC